MRRLILPILFLFAGCETPTPAPNPSPSPSPSPVASAWIQISPTAERGTDFRAQVSVTMAQGETRGFWLKANPAGCQRLEREAYTQIYQARTIKTTTPSAIGLQAGDYPDALIPFPGGDVCSPGLYFVDVTVPVGPTNGMIHELGGSLIEVKVSAFVMPAKPTLPIYIGLNSHALLGAHGLQDHVSFQGPITKKYVDLYRAHRIEPMEQAITNYPPVNTDGTLNLDQWKEYTGSFRQLVLEGAIAPPCLFGPLPTIPPTSAFLAATEKAIQAGTLPADTWAYAWDEGELDPVMTAQALTRVNLIRAGSPSLKINITRREDPTFAAVNTFVPVMDWFKPGWAKPFGLYTSCMAQGRCTNGTPTTPSGTPLMVLDAPSVHALAFPIVAWQLGATLALYYSGTERIATAFTNQYAFGGNGDGTLVYPGANQMPVASHRMKLLREASFMIEWLKRGGVKVPMTNTKDWPRDYAAFQAARDAVAK